MRIQFATLTTLLATAFLASVGNVSLQSQVAGPRFDVVSIKLVPPSPNGQPRSTRITQGPDGGFVATHVSVALLITRAYSPSTPIEIEGLPEWARTERYDVTATSSLSKASPEERLAMLQAMLADRFRFAAHFEMRRQPAFDLVIARDDRRLGPTFVPVDVDCAAVRAAAADAPPNSRPDLNAPPPPCVIRVVGNRVEGEGTMADVATWLRMASGRFVVDKTGLQGTYRLTTEYDALAARRPSDVQQSSSTSPSIFTALPEDLGLRLVSSTTERETLSVDRLEKPTEN